MVCLPWLSGKAVPDGPDGRLVGFQHDLTEGGPAPQLNVCEVQGLQFVKDWTHASAEFDGHQLAADYL